MHQVERQLLSKNMPVLRESLFQPRPLTFTDKAFMPWMTMTLTNSKWSQQIVNAESTWRSIEEQATQNTWFEGESRRSSRRRDGEERQSAVSTGQGRVIVVCMRPTAC